ncbi:MAG: VCBS repeat-containing protein [Thermoguttaceae bacterium]|nr:VCBS repeat-containing protein [Thermoguttaceae bacterium]
MSATDPTRAFELVDPVVYSTDSKIPDSIVCMTRADITTSSVDDLIVVDQATKSIQILQYNTTKEVFDTVYKTVSLSDDLDPNNMSFAFTNVNNDGYTDFVIAKIRTNATKFDLIVYQGGANGSFTRKTPYSSGYTVPFVESNSNYLLGEVRIQAFNTSDIVVQFDVTSKSQSYPAIDNLTYIYTGQTNSQFSTTPTTVSSMMTDVGKTDPSGQQAYVLVGTAKASNFGLGTGDFIVYCDSHTDSSNTTLGFTKLNGSSWDVYKYSLGYGSPVDFVRSAGDNRLVASAQNEENLNVLMVLQSLAADTNKVVTATRSDVLVGNFELGYAVVAAGAYSGTGKYDVVAANGADSRFFKQSGTTEISYTMYSFDISSPAYHSSVLTDLNSDGLDDLLMVGDRYVWYLLADSNTESGFESKPHYIDLAQYETVSFTKAVFGDFNGDGKLDFAVLGTSSTTNLWIYTQYTDEADNISFKRIGTIVSPTEGEGVDKKVLFDFVLDVAPGNFSNTKGDDCDDLALLVMQSAGSGQYVQYVCVYECAAGVNPFYVGRYASSFTGATAIYSANLFVQDTDFDEIILARVDSAKTRAEIYTMNNSATAYTQKIEQNSYIEVASGASGDTIYIDCDDIDGDARVDIAWLYRPSSGSGYSLGYSLQTTSGTFVSTPTATYTISGTANQYTGLVLDYVDDDVYLDLVTTVSGSAGTGVYVVWGQQGDTANKFKWASPYTSPLTSTINAGYGMSAISFGHMTNYHSGGNFTKSSNDVAIAYGNTIAIWSNQAKSSGSSGTAYVLCQNATQSEAANLTAAYNTARLWIDEFSWFSLDIWASSDGAGDINNFSTALDFDSNVFVISSVSTSTTYAQNITFSTTDKSGTFKTITVTGNVTSGHGSDETILLARIYFRPASTEGAGVPLDSNGIFNTAKQILGTDTLSVSSDQITFNEGMPVAQIGETYHNESSSWDKTLDSIEDLYLFPVVFDINDDGIIQSTDYSRIGQCFGGNIDDESNPNFIGSNKVNKLYDIDNSRTIQTSDYSTFTSTFMLGRSSNINSVYERAGISPMQLYAWAHPAVTAVVSGAVADDALLAVAHEIVEEIVEPVDVPQTTSSSNPYDRVLVELSNVSLSAMPDDEADGVDDLTQTAASGNAQPVSPTAENDADKNEMNVLVGEGHSGSVKQGISLSLETELETELV